jgi:hypothetical protein
MQRLTQPTRLSQGRINAALPERAVSPEPLQQVGIEAEGGGVVGLFSGGNWTGHRSARWMESVLGWRVNPALRTTAGLQAVVTADERADKPADGQLTVPSRLADRCAELFAATCMNDGFPGHA